MPANFAISWGAGSDIWSTLGPCRYRFSDQGLEYCRNIPIGETRSYSRIAETIGNPKAVRAIGNAMKYNPVPILIPCHRVIGKDGSMTGYGGKFGTGIKAKLLSIESDMISMRY